MRGRAAPSVTVCIPTFNQRNTVAEAIESARGQSYSDLEILVVDDASTDGTVDVVNDFCFDDRLRVVRNQTNLGLSANHNRCVDLARGRLIKFLHGDDRLLPDCVEALAAPFEDGRIGLAFAPRRLRAADPADADARAWMERYSRPERELDPRPGFIDGRAVVDGYVAAGVDGNWIGEPTSVMVRAACFAAIGGFNRHMAQLLDMDMWLRILARFDAYFVDRELSERTVHRSTATVANYEARSNWLDRLWMLNSLLWSSPPTSRAILVDQWRHEHRLVLRRIAVGRRPPIGAALAAYARCVAGRNNLVGHRAVAVRLGLS